MRWKKREQTTFSVPEGRFDQYILGGKMWQLLWPQVFWVQDRSVLFFCFLNVAQHGFENQQWYAYHSHAWAACSPLRSVMVSLDSSTSDQWWSHSILQLGHFSSVGMIQNDWEWSKWSCASHNKSWTLKVSSCCCSCTMCCIRLFMSVQLCCFPIHQ